MAEKPAKKKAAAKAEPTTPKAPAKAAAPAPAKSLRGDAPPKRRGFKRKMIGVVTSDKAQKTVTVRVIRRDLDAKYGKYVRTRHNLRAHDPQDQYKIGDRVEIEEHRPLSHSKRWIVTRLIVAATEEIQIAGEDILAT